MKKHHWVLLVITILGAVLRLTALNDPITYDEAYTYQIFASKSLFTAISDYHLPNNHIFHSVLVYFSNKILGNHLWAIRLPALLAGIGVIVATYLTGKDAYNRHVGLAAAALVAVSPEEINHATSARGYSLLALFTLLLLFLAILVTRKKHPWAWVAIAIISALGFWTIPLMFFPFGMVFLWLLLSALWGQIPANEDRWSFLRNWLFSGFGAAILTILLYIPVLVVSGWQRLLANSFVSPVAAEEYMGILRKRLLETWTFWIEGIPPFLLVILILGFILALLFHKRISNVRVPIQIPAVLWIGGLVIFRRPDAFSRFWAFLLAPVIIFAAAGIFGWFQATKEAAPATWHIKTFFEKKNLLNLALFGILLFLAYQTILAIPAIPVRWSKQSNAEGAAAYLAERLEPNDMVLVSYPHNPPVWYYLSKLGVPDEAWQAREDFERAYLLVARQTPEELIKAYHLPITSFALEDAIELERYGNIHIILLHGK